MQLFERLRASFRADAHGLIDAMEDRSLLLKQHLRDAESELHKKRTQLAGLLEEQARVDADHESVRGELTRHEADAELALSEGSDELARKALSRALPLAQLVRRLVERRAKLETERGVRADLLATQEHELVTLRMRVEAFLAAEPSVAGAECRFTPSPVTDDQVEIELLRRKRARLSDAASGDVPGRGER